MNALMVFEDHMEDVESLATKALLTRAGFNLKSINLNGKKQVTAHFGTRVDVDIQALESIKAYDLLIIPGGKYVAMEVDQDVWIKGLAKEFYDQGKWIAAICAGPRFLLQQDLIKGAFTAFPGSEVDAKQGTYQPDLKAHVEKPFITARSAGSLYEFVFAIIETFQGTEALDAFKELIKY